MGFLFINECPFILSPCKRSSHNINHLPSRRSSLNSLNTGVVSAVCGNSLALVHVGLQVDLLHPTRSHQHSP